MSQPAGWNYIYAKGQGGELVGPQGPFWQIAVGEEGGLSGEWFPEESDVVAIPDDGSVHVRMHFSAPSGAIPICTEMAFERATESEARNPGTGISAALIRSIDLASLMDGAMVWLSLNAKLMVLYASKGRRLSPGPVWTHDETESTAQEVLSLHRQRSIDDELLSKVADIYLSSSSAPTEAVATALPTSHRNATRYVSLARKRGFLPPYERKTKEDPNGN